MRVYSHLFNVVNVITLLGLSLQVVGAGFEVPDINACKVVTGEEVATLAGGKMLVKPGSNSFSCNYVIEKEDGSAESYQLTFEVPAQLRAILDHADSQEKGKKIEGILDEAYLGRDAMDTQYEVRALRDDKIGMSVTGDREEIVLKIAKFAVTRLPESIPLKKL